MSHLGGRCLCGSCLLENELLSVRTHLGCWFPARLIAPNLELVAEFLVGSEFWLKKRMKVALLEVYWWARLARAIHIFIALPFVQSHSM